jgi:purine-nucleoside phosphorylase
MSQPIGIVSGSGINLTPLLDVIREERPFHRIPGLSEGRVKGHICAFVKGRCAGREVVLQCGRLHVYEGLSFGQVTRAVEVLRDFGVARVLFTNAVGGVDPALKPGDLVAATQIRAWPYHPYGLPTTLTTDFVVPACDASGAYVWMHGPCYETQAEIQALAQLNAHTVGMSTAPEVHRCKQLDLPSGIVSCVTNACGKADTPITHEHVMVTASRASERLCGMLRRWIEAGGGDGD